jgi:hypothetical protein
METFAQLRVQQSSLKTFIFICSENSGTGSMFLCATYGYLLLVGANLISDGSELLLEVYAVIVSVASKFILNFFPSL